MNDSIPDKLVNRTARIPVRISVQVCGKKMKLNEFLNWNPETIVLFDRPIAAPLEISAAHRVIGEGQAVKVGPNIGFRLLRMTNEER